MNYTHCHKFGSRFCTASFFTGLILSMILPNMRHKACLEYITPPLWPDLTIQTQLRIQRLVQPPISKMKKESKVDFHHKKEHASKHVKFSKMARNDFQKVYFQVGA